MSLESFLVFFFIFRMANSTTTDIRSHTYLLYVRHFFNFVFKNFTFICTHKPKHHLKCVTEKEGRMMLTLLNWSECVFSASNAISIRK